MITALDAVKSGNSTSKINFEIKDQTRDSKKEQSKINEQRMDIANMRQSADPIAAEHTTITKASETEMPSPPCKFFSRIESLFFFLIL